MGLEQLLPGGLYKSVVEENKQIKRNATSAVFNAVVDSIEPVTCEVGRDIAYFLGPSVLFLDNLDSEKKVLGFGVMVAYYSLATYGIPFLLDFRAQIINTLNGE